MKNTQKNKYKIRYKKGSGITLRKPLLPISPKLNNRNINAFNTEEINSPKLPIYPPGPRPSINIIPYKKNFNPAYHAKQKNIFKKIREEDIKIKKNKNSKINKGRFIYPQNEYPVNKSGNMFMSYFPINNIGFKH